MSEGRDGIIVAMLLAALAFISGCVVGKDYYHDRLCEERYSHAVIATDSLSIAMDDKHCATYLTYHNKGG